jgi:Soluble lytic murein transglycosylase and related regulatory proteins (some contain LysM/invasin domains)
MATNAETIDSLLVSLGLDVDKKSFQQATDAISDVKNKSLQLLAAAGVGVGFDAWTRGVARYTGELESLSFATKASTRDVEALRHAFRAQGLAAGDADSALRRMADVQRNIQLGKLPAFPGSDALIGKTPVQMLQILSNMLPGMDEQMRLRALQEMGITPGSSTHLMIDKGGFGKKFEAAQEKVTGISPELSGDVAEFNQQMANLQTNFNELSKSMGEKLLPPLNKFLEITNDFISAHPDLVESGVVIAGILGTLKAFKGLKWLLGLSGAAGAGAGSAAQGAGVGLAARFGRLATRGSLLSLLIPANNTPGTAEEMASIGGVGSGISSGNLEKLSQGWSYDERTGWKPPGEVQQHAQSAHTGRKNVPENLIPEFTRASQKHGVPVDVLLGMAKQESGFNPSAVGPQTKWGQAQGIMQYLSGTAASLGIDPLNPSQAIDAAAKQIRERLDKGESIEEAIAHHHAGPNRALWGAKTADYVQKVTGNAAGFRGAEDALAFSQGAYSSPSDSLPGSNYSPETQTIEQTNHVIIQSTGNPVQDQRLARLYTRNWVDSLTSDIY